MKISAQLRSTRGGIDPLTLTIIAIITLAAALKAPGGGPGKNHFWEFWKKNPIEQVNQAAAAVDVAKAQAAAAAAAEQAKIDAAKAAQLKLAQEAALATGSAIDAATATTAAGKLPVKELETAKSLSDANKQAMDQALGAAAPARIRELEAMVQNLNAGVAAGAKALELMQGSLDRTVADKAAAIVERDRVRAEGEKKIALVEGKFADEQKKSQAWALERDALARKYENLYYWGGLTLLLILVLGGWGWLKAHGAGNLSTDLVALTERMKTFIPADVLPSVEQEIQRDWHTAADGTAKAVAKIKATLRI